MRLERLEIRRLPGIAPGFVLENLGEGVHFLTGPNAVGKSSVVRALGYLLRAPERSDPLELWLEARFRASEGVFEVRRVGAVVEWRKDGRSVERPPVAASDEIIYYELSMEHLLTAEADQRFLQEVHRQLRGGFDLGALRTEEPFAVPRQPGRQAQRRLQAASQRLREVKQAYADLTRREADLPRLEAELAALRRRAERRPVVVRALECLGARERRQALEARLSQFPAVLERLKGDEPENLRRLRERRRELSTELERLEGGRRTAEERLRRTGLVEARPTQADLEGIRARLEELQRCSDQLEQARRELAKAESSLEAARRHLGAEEELPRLDPDLLERAREWAIRWDELEERRKRLEAEAAISSDAPSSESLQALETAEALLRAWLEADRAWSPWRFRRPLVVVMVSGLLSAVLAWWSGSPWPALPGLTALAAGLWAWFHGEEVAGPRALQKRWPPEGPEPPRSWSPAEVRRRLDELRARRRELGEEEDRRRRARQAAAFLRVLERDLQAHREAGEGFRKSLGFDPAATLRLVTWAGLLKDYRDAWVARGEAQRSVAALQKDLEEGVTAVGDFLARWGEDGAQARDLPRLRACWDSLQQRWREAEAAERELREGLRRREELQRELARLDREEQELFERAGLEPGRDRDLTELCGRLEEWRRLREEYWQVQGAESDLAAPLADDPEVAELVAGGDRLSLEELREAAETAQRKLEELQKTVATLRHELETAGKDRALEQAASAVEQARRELEDELSAALRAEAAQFLLDEIETEYRAEHEPEVFKTAQAYFAKFTRHAYLLYLEPGSGEIGARETRLANRPRRRLEELSTATRMQLLLALRLAWIARLEQGREALPLFLDEALTTSDPERFTALAGSLEALAGEGRQIFYLTARPEELVWWERATGRRPRHLDLFALRFPAAARDAGGYEVPALPEIPAPGDLSPEEYAARLGVPAWHPDQGWEALPLFYLLRDDLDLLHRLLRDWRVRTWGQLRALLAASAAEALSAEARRKLELRCRVAAAWVAAWRQGRTPPVTALELQASGAVSDTFLEPLEALAAEVGGDARRLLEALRNGKMKGFRRKKIEELAAWLEEKGYIAEAPVLTPGERRLRVLQALGAHGPEVARAIDWLEALAP
ncbi:MAG: AAA family ATPase [Acidobacteriota bacterium]